MITPAAINDLEGVSAGGHFPRGDPKIKWDICLSSRHRLTRCVLRMRFGGALGRRALLSARCRGQDLDQAIAEGSEKSLGDLPLHTTSDLSALRLRTRKFWVQGRLWTSAVDLSPLTASGQEWCKTTGCNFPVVGLSISFRFVEILFAIVFTNSHAAHNCFLLGRWATECLN
jgi:hypothetical protein